MKKTLIALSVLVAAGAANASINIYTADGVTVDMKGDMEVVYKKNDAKDASPKQEIQDADLGFDVRYAINEDISGGAYWEFQGDSKNSDGVNTSDSSTVSMGDVYFALYSKSMGTLKVGDTCTLGDDLGIGADYQFGLNKVFDSSAAFCADEVIKYTLDKGAYYGGIAYRDNQHGSGAEMTDMRVGVRFADIDALVYYGDVARTDDDILAFEVIYSGVDALTLEAGYYDANGKLATDGGKTWALGAEYAINSKVSVAAGYSDTDPANSATKDVTKYFVNVDYKLAPGTKLYAEIGEEDDGAADVELGYAAGVKVEF
ncbi:porin [Vibrio sp. HN007]|uniref:porin n=1 Tax=Vibrio iocasae TaxID=3098914 RepID=UPI0035D43A0A